MEKGEMYYNYQTGKYPAEELPGVSAFYQDENGTIFHTYSTYSRGVDMVMGAYHFLDLVPKGRVRRSIGMESGVARASR